MKNNEEKFATLVPADQVRGSKQGDWSYDDYATLVDDEQRYEIMDGVLLIVPVPSPSHQSISGRLHFYLYQNVV